MSCTVEDNRLPAIYVGYTITCDFFFKQFINKIPRMQMLATIRYNNNN